MSQANSNSQQQFWTNKNSMHYSWYDSNAAWVPISPPHCEGPSGPPPQLLSFHDGFARPGQIRFYRQEQSAYPLEPVHSYPHVQGSYQNSMPPSSKYLPPRSSASCTGPSGTTASTPLPDNDNDNLPSVEKLPEEAACPSKKVAGAQHSIPDPKGKGKQKATEAIMASTSIKCKAASAGLQGDAKRLKGRVSGTTNYSGDDLNVLFDILEESLPLGSNAWNSSSDDFNSWADENGCPCCTAKSLELKFKQLVKTTKPTGDAECPLHVQHAHYIDKLMNEKAGSCDLDNEDIVDAKEGGVIELSSDDNCTPPPNQLCAKSSKKPVVKSEKVQVKAEQLDTPIT